MRTVYLILPLMLSSAPAFAAGSADSVNYLNSTVNFLLLIALIYFAAYKPITRALQNRAEKIKQNLDIYQKDLKVAQERYDQVAAQLESLSGQIDEMNQKADAEIEAMREEFKQRAQEDAERIRQNAQQSIQDEFAMAKRAYVQEVVELAMQTAEKKLRKGINEDDHRRLSEEFVTAVNRGHHA